MDHNQPHPELYNVPYTTESFHGMPYRTLGMSGLWVSNIGLGTWKFGFPDTGDASRVGPHEAFRIFDRAVELGVTFWDTANRYNNASGNSERLIGQWFRANPDQRRNIVIATKIFGGMDGRTPNHSRASRGNILDSVYACLKRMQVDYIDVLYFHRFDDMTPVEESLATISDLVSRDMIRYFAVSNFTADQLRYYRATESQLDSRCRVLAVQNQYDIVRGELPTHAGVLEYCATHGVSYVAHGPLATGLLTNRYLDLSKVGPGDRVYDEKNLGMATETVMSKVHQLADLADAWGMELSQLTLAYMLSLPGMGPVIPGASTVAQLESNAKAGTVVLNAEQKSQVAYVLTGDN